MGAFDKIPQGTAFLEASGNAGAEVARGRPRRRLLMERRGAQLGKYQRYARIIKGGLTGGRCCGYMPFTASPLHTNSDLSDNIVCSWQPPRVPGRPPSTPRAPAAPPSCAWNARAVRRCAARGAGKHSQLNPQGPRARRRASGRARLSRCEPKVRDMYRTALINAYNSLEPKVKNKSVKPAGFNEVNEMCVDSADNPR